MAFDECTFYPADRDYTKKAMERTHRWLERSIGAWKADSGSGTPQHLYGIIQGGAYEDLRKESARFVASKDVDGVAIGGVSVGEPRELMRKELGWVSDFLPHEKPVHLLGVGRIADFVDLVALGIDTFDCAEPTRLSREGKIYRLAEMDFSEIVSQKDDERGMWMDITSPRYRLDTSPLGRGCGCAVCTRFSKSYLHHLFRQREISAYVLATYHNVYSIMRLFQDIRAAIVSGVL